MRISPAPLRIPGIREREPVGTPEEHPAPEFGGPGPGDGRWGSQTPKRKAFEGPEKRLPRPLPTGSRGLEPGELRSGKGVVPQIRFLRVRGPGNQSAPRKVQP